MQALGFLQSELKDGENFSVVRYTGIHVMPVPHIHSHYEMYFCPENILQRSVINGVEYDHRYPTVIISKPYTIHSNSCLESSGTSYERYVFSMNENAVRSFDTPMLSRILESSEMGLFFRLYPEEASFVRDIIERVFFNSDFPLEENEYEAAISLILTKIYNFSRGGRIIELGRAESYVQRALRYISENYHVPITSEALAERFSVSRSKLDRDFRLATGTTPKTFLDTCRFNRAAHLLRTRHDMTVAEVAESVGFANITYFFRFFARHGKMSPNVYRKLHKNERE